MIILAAAKRGFLISWIRFIRMEKIRNIAIIAHVDHGKTTLVDALLRQSKTELGKELVNQSLIMDSNELEKERGITIFSKNASVMWNGIKINIIDTPGHADFGGEVERVLTMADGCLLLVDAKEGPMAQTRFVLKQALALGHKVIVVINKIDKPDARPDFVLGKVFDLFAELGASDETIDFPVVYASAKLGKAGFDEDINSMSDISPVFEAIIKHIPEPAGDPNAPLQMLISQITYDVHKGRIATGKVYNGILKSGQEVAYINRDGQIAKYKLTSLITFAGLGRVDAQEVPAGDIASISGIPDINIGETVTDPKDPKALPLIGIEEPTIRMVFSVNSSPFAGKEGEFKTSREIRARLFKELETDVALKVEDGPKGDWIVSGRGELHLAILIERLRREGYEFAVARPQVIEKKVDGKKYTPHERVFIEAPEPYSGIVMQEMGKRHAKLIDMKTENGIVYYEFTIATSEFFGYRSQFLTDTRGLGIINANFWEYQPTTGFAHQREHGSLVATDTGITRLYGLVNIQDRGTLFIGPAVNVYKGQVVGENARGDDMHVNVCKEKQLSNMRSKGDGGAEHFNAPKDMGLEDALEYIDDSELVEVTPQNIRIRKIIMDEVEERRRKRNLA